MTTTVNYNRIAQEVKREIIALRNRHDQLQKVYSTLLQLRDGVGTGTHSKTGPGRVMSAAGLQRIRAAQKARWAKYHKTHKKAS